jgi:EmrB/QacA subfamily drug resistance transporter
MNTFAAPRALARRGPSALLVLVCLAQFMVILDVSIVNVALPSIRSDLNFSATGLQWVVNAYTLTFAGFLLLGGRASDLLGRRSVFLFGIALFTIASLACALADSRGLLLGARALQGLGGAVISPASLAIITTSFAEGAERNRALGVWGAMAGLGGTSGVFLGGLLTQGLGWPFVFLINVPVGAAVIFFGRSLVPAGKRAVGERHFDVTGAVLVTAGLMALVYGIVRTDALGWTAAGVLGPLGAGVALLIAFVIVEGKVARAPLMPLGIFRQRRLRAANLVILMLGSGMFAMWFFLSLYLQQVLGADALETGVGFLPMTLTIVAVSSLAPRFIARIGPGRVLAAGMFSAATGLALLTGVHADSSYLGHVLPGGLLAGAGLGVSMVSATIVAVHGVAPGLSGLASGLINTSRLVGGALGLAALSTLAESRTRAELASGASALPALTEGFQAAFAAGAVLCLIGGLTAAILLRTPMRRRCRSRRWRLRRPSRSLPDRRASPVASACSRMYSRSASSCRRAHGAGPASTDLIRCSRCGRSKSSAASPTRSNGTPYSMDSGSDFRPPASNTTEPPSSRIAASASVPTAGAWTKTQSIPFHGVMPDPLPPDTRNLPSLGRSVTARREASIFSVMRID